MAGDLNTLKSYIDSGDYQTAYNQARAAGYGLDDIASFVNQNYGTKYGASDFKQYEPGSMANLKANNYNYITYDNGIGQGTPLKIGSPYLNSAVPDYSKPYTPDGSGAVIGPFPASGGASNKPNVNNNTNLTNYNQNTPQTDLSLGLPALYPRRRADQSFNRGNNYFNMGSGNYQNRFA